MEKGVRKGVKIVPVEYSGRRSENKKSGSVNIRLSMGRYLENIVE